MIRHVWTVFCSSSAIDKDTNQVSLFDIIEKINVELVGAPPPGEKVVVPSRFQVVTLWSRAQPNEPEAGSGRLRLMAPGGQELLKSENDIDLTEYGLRRVRVNLAGMPFVGNGQYRFVVDQRVNDEWKMVAEVPIQFEVQIQLPAPAPPEQPAEGRPRA
jgi:hypothetical protein